MRFTSQIKILVLFVLMTAFGHSFAIAQYPFEKYKAIKYKRIKFKIKYSKDKNYQFFSANLKRMNKQEINYSIVIKASPDIEHTIIYIKKNGKIIQKFIEHCEFASEEGLYPLYVGDINGDSLLDIKFSSKGYSHGGIGGPRRVYLFQKANGRFKKISFDDTDFDDSEYPSNSVRFWPVERDFNNDGNFEIITRRFIEYKHHSYWIFDVYNYINGELVCVDDKYNYPIMIQYLYRQNYEITKRISPKKMKSFKKLKPDGYDKR